MTSHKIRELIPSNEEFRALREKQIFSMNNDMSDLWRIPGAMLISPLLGPIYALAVYIAIGDVKTTLRCIQILGLMVVMLVVISAISSFALSFIIDLPLTP